MMITAESNSSSTEIGKDTEMINSEQVSFETVENKRKENVRIPPYGYTNNKAKKLYTSSRLTIMYAAGESFHPSGPGILTGVPKLFHVSSCCH